MIVFMKDNLKRYASTHSLLPTIRRTGRGALLPIPPPSPPPPEAQTYVLTSAGTLASGAVGVVDLGDGERWLQGLHAHAARAPVLLWRAPHRSRNASAPLWLQRRSGYLLAAHSLRRLQEFLIIDTYGARGIGPYKSANQLNVLHLQLSSLAPVVLAVGGESDHWRGPHQWQKDSRRTLSALWHRHQSFRGLLTRETSSGEWSGCVIDPLLNRSNQTPQDTTPGAAVAAVIALAAKRSRDLGGNRVVTMFNLHNFPKWTRPSSPNEYDLVVSIELYVMTHLGKLFNFVIHEYPTTQEINEKYVTAASILLYFGIIDINGTPFTLTERHTELELMSGSSIWDKYVLLVPYDPLPAWSLPLRVFSGDVWGALMSAVVVYSLTWRVLSGESMAASVATAFRAFSSSAGPPQGRVRSTSQRIQLTGVLLASAVVMATIYQGRIYELLVKPDREYLQSIEELKNSKLLLVSYYTGFPYHSTEQWPFDRQSWTYESKNEIFRRHLRKERFAFVEKSPYWDVAEAAFQLSARWKIFPDSVTRKCYFFYARWNWPWSDVFNVKMLELVDKGFWSLWKRRNIEIQILFFLTRLLPQFEKENLSLSVLEFGAHNFSLEDVWPMFNCLAVGMLLAIFIFTAERCRVISQRHAEQNGNRQACFVMKNNQVVTVAALPSPV